QLSHQFTCTHLCSVCPIRAIQVPPSRAVLPRRAVTIPENRRTVATDQVRSATGVTLASLHIECITRNIAHLGVEQHQQGHWVVPLARAIVTDKSHARIHPVRPALSPHTTEVAVLRSGYRSRLLTKMISGSHE